ncbi:GNAT family N-acetyltransferase [Raoultella terrigena]|uniref:GNAT family N-acetyltransferase n=1 Tax=Raoultella terrigena TaxID=577 RepID=UPI00349F9BE2
MKYTESPRLIIRSFQDNDAEDMFEYLSNPRVACFMDQKLHSLEEAVSEITRRQKEEHDYAISLKETGALIGELFADNSREPAPDTYGVGWLLNKKYEGMGFAREAAQAFFDYLFNHKHARRIYAYVADYNEPSQNLCRHLGMRLEGCFKEHVSFITDNEAVVYENTLVFAVLAKEWRYK